MKKMIFGLSMFSSIHAAQTAVSPTKSHITTLQHEDTFSLPINVQADERRSCFGCCNQACKPSKTCCLGWTCLAVAGPPFCALNIVGNILGFCCLPSAMCYEASLSESERAEPFSPLDDTPWIKPFKEICCEPASPKDPKKVAFLKAVCELPLCAPCGWWFGVETRYKCCN